MDQKNDVSHLAGEIGPSPVGPRPSAKISRSWFAVGVGSSAMEIFFTAVWLSLTFSSIINVFIHRTLSNFSDQAPYRFSPLMSLHLANSSLFTGLYVVVFLPVLSQYWINPTSMLWRTNPFICRIFTAVSDSLATCLICSLTAIFIQRQKNSKEDISDFWMLKLTLFVSFFSFLASMLYSVAIPLINSWYIVNGMANCPANAGIILNSSVPGLLIIVNCVCTLSTVLYAHRGPREWPFLVCGIQRVWHCLTNVTCGCTIWLGLACLPFHFVGFSLTSPLYNTTRHYLTVLVLVSTSGSASLYEGILLDGSNERNMKTEELTRIQSV